MTKRLTAQQKEEIVISFKAGMDIDTLSKKYSCTESTIIRNLKKNLSLLKFKELFNKSKSLKGKSKKNKNQTNNFPEINFEKELKELEMYEKNRQLNQLSLLFYKKLKQNTIIKQ